MTTAPLEIEYQQTKALDITAIAIVNSAPLVFCGKEDGTVHIYDISITPKQEELFVQTRSCPIILLHYDFASNLLTCCDTATRVTTRKVSRGPRNTWAVSEVILETRPGTKVEQIACSGRHGRVLVPTDDHNTLWVIGGGDQESSPPSEYLKRIDGSTRPSWVQHANSDTLIRIMDFGANIYSWSDFCLIRTVSSFPTLDPPMTDSVIQLQHNRFFATISKDKSSHNSGSLKNQRSAIHVWDMTMFEAPHTTVTPKPSNSGINSTTTKGNVKPAIDLGTLSTVVEQAIGITNGRFVFLDRDYWICSIDLTMAPITWNKDFTPTGSTPNLERRFSDGGVRQNTLSIEPGNVVRHFFVPYEWISMVTKVQAGMGSRREIIFVNRSELAIVKKGLDVCEQGLFKPSRAAEGASVSAGGSSSNRGLLPVRPGRATMSGGIWNRERYSV